MIKQGHQDHLYLLNLYEVVHSSLQRFLDAVVIQFMNLIQLHQIYLLNFHHNFQNHQS